MREENTNAITTWTRERRRLDMAEIDRRLAEEEVRYSDLIAALEARPPRWQKENRLTPG